MPATDTIRRRLEQGIGRKRSVHVWLRKASYSTDGFVLATGRKWVLLARTTEGGFFDGHMAIRLSAISAVTMDTGFQPRFSRTQSEWPPGLPAGVDDVDLNTTRRMLSTLLRGDRIVGLVPDRPVIWIGVPYRLSGRTISLWEVDPKARWAKKPREHPLGLITTVQLGSQYLRGLEAVAGPPPREALDSAWAKRRGTSARSKGGKAGTKDAGFCCAPMALQMQWRCDLHPSLWDCPDVVVVRQAKGGYGLPVRTGEDSTADSSISIGYCPWCGSRLNSSRRSGTRILEL